MTTALELITDALFEIGVQDIGQAVSADDSSMGLRYLNRLLQRWSNSPGMYPVVPEVSVPLTGAASYTIGPSGADVTSTRMLRVDRATCIDAAGFESSVNVLAREQWDDIATKDVSGGPVSDVWYNAAVTTGTIYVYPKAPSGYTLKLEGSTLLASFSGLSTVVTLPAGYESAIVPSLAIDLAPAYQVPVSSDLRMKAAGAVRALKRMNAESLMLTISLAGGQDYRIERGY